MNRDEWEIWLQQHSYLMPKFEIGDVVRTPTGLLAGVFKRTTKPDGKWQYTVRLHHLHLLLTFDEPSLEAASAVDRLGGLA